MSYLFQGMKQHIQDPKNQFYHHNHYPCHHYSFHWKSFHLFYIRYMHMSNLCSHHLNLCSLFQSSGSLYKNCQNTHPAHYSSGSWDMFRKTCLSQSMTRRILNLKNLCCRHNHYPCHPRSCCLILTHKYYILRSYMSSHCSCQNWSCSWFQSRSNQIDNCQSSCPVRFSFGSLDSCRMKCQFRCSFLLLTGIQAMKEMMSGLQNHNTGPHSCQVCRTLHLMYQHTITSPHHMLCRLDLRLVGKKRTEWNPPL